MFKLQFENSRGESVALFDKPYRLASVRGIGDVGADIQMQRTPYQDGARFIDSVLEPRYMEIELKIYGKGSLDLEANRRKLANVFNPRLKTGSLKYINNGTERTITAIAESVPFF
ncbi:MAG: phage tail domain-containing protein, partial [Candidatus Saccharimonadales bacterium]